MHPLVVVWVRSAHPVREVVEFVYLRREYKEKVGD